jgi:DNA-binding PadR family transcriptional regulator
MMLFLFSERLFTRDCFTDFAMTMSWDTERFNRMLKDEWIIIWRKRTGMESNLYELSFKGKRLVRSVYKKLNGEERLSDNYQNNPMFAKNASYTDKRYRRIVKKMNDAIKR